jgi:hypothetical protein
MISKIHHVARIAQSVRDGRARARARAREQNEASG